MGSPDMPKSRRVSENELRAGRFLAPDRGAFRDPLDVHVAPTLRARMEEMGLAPIGHAITGTANTNRAGSRPKPRNPRLIDMPTVTGIIQ